MIKLCDLLLSGTYSDTGITVSVDQSGEKLAFLQEDGSKILMSAKTLQIEEDSSDQFFHHVVLDWVEVNRSHLLSVSQGKQDCKFKPLDILSKMQSI